MTTEIIFTIEELCKKYNEINENDNTYYEDSRIKKTLTVRRIRDLISKNLISEGFRNGGKEKYYNQTHLDQLISIRKKTILGITDRTLSKLDDKNNLSNSLDDIIKNIETSTNLPPNKIFCSSVLRGTPTLIQAEEKIEYQINNDLKLSIIKNSNFTEDKIKIILNQIENILKTNQRNKK